jgi:adenylyltransferase/sulfurtransferase
MRLPDFGIEGQRRLREASVMVAGVGGLGGYLAEYLVRSGVGHVRIVDRDRPALVNLHRQIQYSEADVANRFPKAEAASRRLRGVNSCVVVESVVDTIDVSTIGALLDGVHLVLDGTDNFDARHVINDGCVERRIPWVYGGAVGHSGMVMGIRPGAGPCLRCLLPATPTACHLPTCNTEGIWPPLVGVIASVQSSLALSWLLGFHDDCVSSGCASLYTIEMKPPSMKTLAVRRDPSCPVCRNL